MGQDLRKRALFLAWFTVGYNVLEGILSLLAGWLSGSIALVGFGIDSAIESSSGAIVIWRLGAHGNSCEEEEERAEKKALRLIGMSFLVLAAYVAYGAGQRLYMGLAPEPSLFGMAIALASLIVMPVLARAKQRAGRALGLASIVADSKQTFICTLLSAALLVGLGLNYLWGMWWADPLSALVIAGFIVREGMETLKTGRACSC